MKQHALQRLAVVLLALVANAAFGEENDAGTVKLARQVCATCHGPKGESVSPAFPRIAGQRPEYVEAQLKAFRDRTRADPMAQAYMWGMTTQLGDDAIKSLAAYYGKQKPVHAKAADRKLAALGRPIYEQGLPDQGIPACGTCHGKEAEGTAAFPRLAGQHAEYLVKQLALFKSSLRADANAAVMHDLSMKMSFDQMEAVAAYLSSK